VKIKLSPTAQGLLSIYIPSIILSFGQGMVVPVIPLLAKDFQVSPGLAAQVITAHLLGRALFLVPSGIIVDRLGTRSAMIFGPIIIAAGTLATAFTPHFSLLLAAQLVIGAGGGLWHLGREIAAVGMVRQERRGRLISSFFGISSVGQTVGPVAGGAIADFLGFRILFHAYTGMALFVLALALAIKEGQAPPPVQRAPMLSLGKLNKIDPYFRTTFIILIFATFAAILRHTTVNSMLPLYVGTELGKSATQVGGLFGIMGAVTLATIVPAGFISDKLGRKAATVPAAALSAVIFLAFYFAHDMVSLSIFCAVLGVASGLAMGSMTTSTYDIVPEGARGRYQAIRRGTGEIGSLTGPLVGGVIANAYSPGKAFIFFAPLHLASALLLAFVARETLSKRRPRNA
jgi:MFS family permease